MKNTVLRVTLFLCLFSLSILRGQTTAPTTTKTVEKEVKIIKTKTGGTTKTTKTTTTTSAKPPIAKAAGKSTAKKTTHKVEKVIIKTNEEVVKVQPATTSKVEVAVPMGEVKEEIKDVVKEAPKTTTGGPAPITGIPVMTFDKKLFDFGQIKMGDTPSITYTFTNTGNAPLDIDIVTGCDCTELDWTRTTVAPGEKGFVSAKYNSNKAEEEDHKKQLEKYVDIILKQTHPSNGYPLVESLKFKVFIVD